MDYALVVGLILIIVLGFVINFRTANWANFQAYILMILTYIYAKESTDYSNFRLIGLVIRAFVFINATLVILQTATGSYFPARYLASGDPPLLIACGVSDGPTKNGFLISFSLSYMLGCLIFKKLKFSKLDYFTFFLGLLSLALSASRAGIISFALVFIMAVPFGVIRSRLDSSYEIRRSFWVFTASILFFVVGSVIYFALSFGILYELRGSGVDNYGLAVLEHKSTVFMDSSMGERFGTLSYFLNLLKESPLSFLSVGYGSGSFITLYGLNMHNSWVELFFTLGIYGFILFLTLTFYVFYKALSSSFSVRLIPLLFSVLSIMIFMLAHDVVRGRIFWTGLGMLGALSLSFDPKAIKDYCRLQGA
ncbi:hypothetical protein EUZ85_13445 [Hahella sp. KA22]|uniref:hypothetical protein n=1 Tax=Hahella sp. KA22 TaxID=1628392 RepID=UPI000FDEB20E|nr:hypothetical protein [Hahella sp. KA22]AZZ91680.1 hypothetical protein ENC22_10885 [Hahella sp. KA22]QAY55050.1 hypothetical protein EUZ85_13445 [Hahella sp. KA22]